MTRRNIFLTICAATILIVFISYLLWPRPTAEQVMADFYAAIDRAEDMVMDPLILNSDTVAAVVILSVKDKSMKKRRYAIGFLGNEKISEALPVLRSILADKSEEEYFRADALESIYQIDRTEGLSLAQNCQSSEDFLSYIASGLISGEHIPFQRTYIEALVGDHN